MNIYNPQVGYKYITESCNKLHCNETMFTSNDCTMDYLGVPHSKLVLLVLAAFIH